MKSGMTLEDIVVDLVALSGGKLTGRTRLQKQAYLLKRCGAKFDLHFTYHHYGPYSFDLVEGLSDALAKKRMDVKEETGRYGVRYAKFTLKENPSLDSAELRGLTDDIARRFIDRMKGASDVVLELAATIVFLRDEWDYYGKEKIDEIQETKSRKPLKATDNNIEKAIALLKDLCLQKQEQPQAS